MRFRVLGSLEIDEEGRPLALGGRRQRVVLAHLLLRANRVVPAEVLIAEVWGEEPPDAARGTLQAYVSRLRSVLGEERLEGRPPGYVLHVGPGELDVGAFEAGVRDARADAAQDPAAAIAAFEQALSLWRGSPLADLADEPSLQGEIARLEELRLGAIEERISAILAVGGHAAVVGDLEALTRQRPLRERLWGDLMLALYRSGRQAEALEAFRRARAVLADELGIDPSRRLQRLHDRILAQDPALSSPSRPMPVPPRPSAAPGELAPDTELAGYRVEDVLGRGGMSTVYLAEDLRLRRRIALKVLSPELTREPGFRERFVHESQVAAGLEHPGIVPIYEAGEAEGNLYIAMRYVRGTDLRRLLAECGPLDPDRAVRIVRHVAEALDAAHAEGLVHRDVKPANILLVEDAEGEGRDLVYLSDFGLTKRLEGSGGPRTRTGQFVGTVEYVAPEQIEGRPVDRRADVYSLACVLYECLTGRSPFRRDTEVATLYAHVRDEPPRLSAERPDLPEELDAVLAAGLAKAPSERYASCRELAAAARAALEPAAPGPAASSMLRGPRLVATIVTVLVLGIAGLLLGISRFLGSDAAQRSPVVATSPTPSPHFATLDRPPTADERRLLTLIPREIGSTCAPYDQPPAILASGDDPVGAVACDTGAVDVLYELFNDRGSMDAAFGKRAYSADAYGGDCARDATAQNPYTVAGQPAGRVLCDREGGGSLIAWTDERVLVFAEAFRADLGDISLYDWWLRAGPDVTRTSSDKDPSGRLMQAPLGSYLTSISPSERQRIATLTGESAGSWPGTWFFVLGDGSFTVRPSGRFASVETGTFVLSKGEESQGPRLVMTGSCGEGVSAAAAYGWALAPDGSVRWTHVATLEYVPEQREHLGPGGTVPINGSCVPGPWPMIHTSWVPAPEGMIAYSSAQHQLVGVSMETTEYSDLSPPGGSEHDNVQPVWSPDGEHIAFSSDRAGGDFDLYVMNADGSDLHPLTDAPGDEFDPAWSPDGTKVVFHERPYMEDSGDALGSTALSVVSVVDGSVSELLVREGDVGRPAWSPDGSRIAFRTVRHPNSSFPLITVYVIDPDGSNLVKLSRGRSVPDSAPAWTPGGGRILFLGDGRDGEPSFLSIRPDGSDVQPFGVSLPGDFLTLDWSPDGRWMVLGGSVVSPLPLYLISSDGRWRFVLENSAGEPRWRPQPH